MILLNFTDVSNKNISPDKKKSRENEEKVRGLQTFIVSLMGAPWISEHWNYFILYIQKLSLSPQVFDEIKRGFAHG